MPKVLTLKFPRPPLASGKSRRRAPWAASRMLRVTDRPFAPQLAWVCVFLVRVPSAPGPRAGDAFAHDCFLGAAIFPRREFRECNSLDSPFLALARQARLPPRSGPADFHCRR